MKFYRNTLISKGVVKHKKRKEGKQRHIIIYKRARIHVREEKNKEGEKGKRKEGESDIRRRKN